MNATKDHTSLETGKLLKDCGVGSKYVFSNPGGVWIAVHSYDIMPDVELYPAFTWGEILWEHAEKFFGEKAWNDRGISYKECLNLPEGEITNWTIRDEHEIKILSLLQQKRYNEADEYFRNTCILISKK